MSDVVMKAISDVGFPITVVLMLFAFGGYVLWLLFNRKDGMFTLYYRKQVETLDHAQKCQTQTAEALSDLASVSADQQDDRKRMMKVALRGCDLLDKAFPIISVQLDESTNDLRKQIRHELEAIT